MNLYLLEQTENKTYDTYDLCVVCAESEKDAKTIDPNGGEPFVPNPQRRHHHWAKTLEGVICKYIGVAASGVERGVICASYISG